MSVSFPNIAKKGVAAKNVIYIYSDIRFSIRS